MSGKELLMLVFKRLFLMCASNGLWFHVLYLGLVSLLLYVLLDSNPASLSCM